MTRRFPASASKVAESLEPAEFLALDPSQLLEQMPSPVLVVDRHGIVSYTNTALDQCLGFRSDELCGHSLARLSGRSEHVAHLFGAAAASKSRHDIELRHRDGSMQRFVADAKPLTGPNGQRVGCVISLHEPDDESEMLTELRAANAELEQYVQNVTHDLRSPLVSLLGFLRLLRQEYGEQLDDTGRHFLDRIEQASRTMETLIQDLLELSRIGVNETQTQVNVNDVLKQLRAELKPRLESLGVELELPPEPHLVLCDWTRLYQVFSNLIGNALDYMGPCAEPRIGIEVCEEDAWHRISVHDNGRGIPEGQAERIFELFQTAGQRADGRRGTGIGLAIVKKIAQSQGGHVWVESQPGQGASFHFRLPRS